MRKGMILAIIGLVAAVAASSALASGTAKAPPPVNCNCDPGGGYWDFVGTLGDGQSYHEFQNASSGSYHLKYHRAANNASGWFRSRSSGAWEWDAAPAGSHDIDNLYSLSTYDGSRVINYGAATFVEVLINDNV
jgi:hypothetical protein